MDSRFTGMALALLMLGTAAGSALAQSVVWQRQWTNEAPPTLGLNEFGPWPPDYRALVDFAGNGDLLFWGLTYFGSSIDVLRMSADGATGWSAKLPADRYGTNSLVGPTLDGGALVGIPDLWNQVTKLDATGTIQWTRNVPSKRFATLSATRIATATCKYLSALDLQSGELAWQIAYPIAGSIDTCALTGFQATADAGVVASIIDVSNNHNMLSRTFKTGEDGSPLWEYSTSEETAQLIGVDNDRVYLATYTGLLALDAASGELLWQSAPFAGSAVLLAGEPATPVMINESAIQGFDGASGTVLWNQAIASTGRAWAIGDALVVDTVNGLVKLSAQEGSPQWTTTLPTTDSLGHPLQELLGVGGLAQGQFTAVAQVDAPGAQPSPFLQRIDFLSGQLSTTPPIAPVVQGNSGVATIAGDHVYSLAAEQGAQSARYRLRKVDAGDGDELWSRVDPPFVPELVQSPWGLQAELTASGSLVVAAISEGPSPRSNAAVSAWDRNSGNLRWRSLLTPASEEWHGTRISKPQLSSDSDVLVSLATLNNCVEARACLSAGIYRLDAGNGSPVWQHRDSLALNGGFAPAQTAPAFVEVGNDVVAASSISQTLKRFDGANGSVIWEASTQSLGTVASLYLASDGNVIAVGLGGWAKFNATTGSLVWSAETPALSCPGNFCEITRTLPLPDGSLLQTGTLNNSNGGQSAMAALLHTDGSGEFELWFPQQNAPLRTLIRAAEVDSQGRVWMAIRESLDGTDLRLWSLTRFDQTSGQFMGRQALMNFSDKSLSSSFSVGDWLSAPEGNRLPIRSEFNAPPAPISNGIVMLDTSVSATGNLALEATLPSGAGNPGEEVPFQFEIRYDGRTALNQVRLHAVLPLGGAPSGLKCTLRKEPLCRGNRCWHPIQLPRPAPIVTEIPCDIDTRDGDLHVAFPVGPREVITVEGALDVQDSAGPSPVLSGLIQGPTGLLEQDTRDNFVSVPIPGTP